MVRSVISDMPSVRVQIHRRLPGVRTFRYCVLEMCGRFTLKSPSRIRLERFNRANLPPLFPRYNIAPSQSVLGIVNHGDELEGRLMKWGLVPSRSTDSKGFINARAETITEKLSFSESFQRRRCLIPADGFYEWQRTGEIAQPYFFQKRDESPFAFAGIWDEWKGDETIVSCAIITTRANELLAPIHDRMPVILRSDAQEVWLNADTEAAKELLTPFPASEMTSHAVGYEVNHTKIDDESLLTPVEPNLGVTRRLF